MFVLVYRILRLLLEFIQIAHPPKRGLPLFECSGGLAQCAALLKPLISGKESRSIPDSVTKIRSALTRRPTVLNSWSLVFFPTQPCALAYNKMIFFVSMALLLVVVFSRSSRNPNRFLPDTLLEEMGNCQ